VALLVETEMRFTNTFTRGFPVPFVGIAFDV
jgi:hypothetical protein